MRITNLVETTKQMNFYTFIFNKIMEHLQKIQNISFYKKNEEWKNELENILQIVREFFNLKTQYPYRKYLFMDY